MTADFMQQWEQFEHNSAPPGLAAAALTLSCPPARHSGTRTGGLRGSIAEMHVARARMLVFTSGTSPESDCSEGGLEKTKLQTYNSVGGSGGKKQSHFPGAVAAAWLFWVSAAGIHWETTQTSPTQGNVCCCLGGERLNFRNCTSSLLTLRVLQNVCSPG